MIYASLRIILKKNILCIQSQQFIQSKLKDIGEMQRKVKDGQVRMCCLIFLVRGERDVMGGSLEAGSSVQVLLLSVVSRLRPTDLEPTTRNKITLSQHILQNKNYSDSFSFSMNVFNIFFQLTI